MFKRMVRWIKAIFTVLGMLVVIIVTTPLSEYLSQPLRLEGQPRHAQAIVVLGGGASKDGYASIPSLARAVYGFSLFRAGYAPRILLSGGAGNPKGWARELGHEKAAPRHWSAKQPLRNRGPFHPNV